MFFVVAIIVIILAIAEFFVKGDVVGGNEKSAPRWFFVGTTSVGKSSLMKELRRRGWMTRDIDDIYETTGGHPSKDAILETIKSDMKTIRKSQPYAYVNSGAKSININDSDLPNYFKKAYLYAPPGIVIERMSGRRHVPQPDAILDFASLYEACDKNNDAHGIPVIKRESVEHDLVEYLRMSQGSATKLARRLFDMFGADDEVHIKPRNDWPVIMMTLPIKEIADAQM